MKTQFIISIKIFVALTVLCGVLYPLLITGIAQTVFHKKANGSMIAVDNKVIGSELIGQKFDSAYYFLPRPSAIDYNPLPSGGSNYGPTSAKLKEQVNNRILEWEKRNQQGPTSTIPSEMLFASGSGLDPHISPRAAMLQVGRITKVRHLNEEQKQQLVNLVTNLTEQPQFLLLGEPRINVLKLNLALDKIKLYVRNH